MKPGYSKLLMSEFVLPVTNCPLYPALLDVNMMGEYYSFLILSGFRNSRITLHNYVLNIHVVVRCANSVSAIAVLNGMERTEAQFTKLLDAAGLKVVKFWSVGAETEGLVEAVLKD